MKTFKNISLSFILIHIFFSLVNVNLEDVFVPLSVSVTISETFLFHFRALRHVLVKFLADSREETAHHIFIYPP
jgi:hypothetical protein